MNLLCFKYLLSHSNKITLHQTSLEVVYLPMFLSKAPTPTIPQAWQDSLVWFVLCRIQRHQRFLLYIFILYYILTTEILGKTERGSPLYFSNSTYVKVPEDWFVPLSTSATLPLQVVFVRMSTAQCKNLIHTMYKTHYSTLLLCHKIILSLALAIRRKIKKHRS